MFATISPFRNTSYQEDLVGLNAYYSINEWKVIFTDFDYYINIYKQI